MEIKPVLSHKHQEENGVETRAVINLPSKDLLNNKNTVVWNQLPEDIEDAEVDLETGKTVVPKKQTKKYPNAPVVLNLFEEVLGHSELFWRKTPAVLECCERLYTERGLEKIRNALEFYHEHKEDKYCPKITSPKSLEEKYTNLSHYKNRL